MPNWTKKFGYGDFIHIEHRNCKACMMKGDTFFREVEENCFEVSSRQKDMEATGVTHQVLSTIPVLFNYWAKATDGLETSRFLNDHLADAVAKNPKEFSGLGTVPLQDVDLAIGEMERCKNELGLVGLEIGTNINGDNLSEKKFLPLFKRAEELNVPIFVHPWEMMGEDQMQKYWLPWLVGMPAETSRAICSLIFGGVMKAFPTLRFSFAHGGGSFPATIGRVEHGYNVRPDLVQIDNEINPRDFLGKFWIDSLVHDVDALHYIIKIIGEDKICLGSDYPFPLGEHHPGKLIEEVISHEKLKENLLFKNAHKWLYG